MERFVYNIFKTILKSMIFIFVFDMAFYMINFCSLDSKVQLLTIMMSRDIANHNGLDDWLQELYQSKFEELADSYGCIDVDENHSFVQSITSNAFTDNKTEHTSFKRKSEKYRNYYDVRYDLNENMHENSLTEDGAHLYDTKKMCLEVTVTVSAPIWNFSAVKATDWGVGRYAGRELKYVRCVTTLDCWRSRMKKTYQNLME